MVRIGCLGWSLLLVVGCSDDGHVVGEMQTEGGGGTTTITATGDGGTVGTGTTGSDGDVSTGTANDTATSSGGAGAGGTTSATTQTSTGSGSGGAANSTGGGAGADASSGGTSGASGETATSTTGSDPCPPGQIWCPACNPGEGICSAGGCPGVVCPSCSYITTLEECESTYGCHAVFSDPETCGCVAIGCCTRFAFCAPGSEADCEGPATCASVAPYCPEPVYVPSYANGCIEGCVRPEVCAD